MPKLAQQVPGFHLTTPLPITPRLSPSDEGDSQMAESLQDNQGQQLGFMGTGQQTPEVGQIIKKGESGGLANLLEFGQSPPGCRFSPQWALTDEGFSSLSSLPFATSLTEIPSFWLFPKDREKCPHGVPHLLRWCTRKSGETPGAPQKVQPDRSGRTELLPGGQAASCHAPRAPIPMVSSCVRSARPAAPGTAWVTACAQGKAQTPPLPFTVSAHTWLDPTSHPCHPFNGLPHLLLSDAGLFTACRQEGRSLPISSLL